jgi:uncharacterized protein (TIGR00725 family)
MKGHPTLADTTIGVVGSGTDGHDELAREIGVLLATLGVNLLTGGGRGVMASVSRAFTQSTRRQGICIGIIPSLSDAERATPKRGYPNPFVELAIYTHLPISGERGTEEASRNHINVLSSAGIVALPGSAGTLSEVSLALEYAKPIIAYASDSGSLAAFPKVVRRTSSLADVEAFVRNICYASALRAERPRR